MLVSTTTTAKPTTTAPAVITTTTTPSTTTQSTSTTTAARSCYSGPFACQNGGTCAGSYCICPCGWTGPYCSAPDRLLPYGQAYGDSEVGPNQLPFYLLDDGYWQIILPQDFMFGCSRYRTLYININGYLTFVQPIISYTPKYFPFYSQNLGIIAAQWTDIDLRPFYGVNPGRLFYQCYSRYIIGQSLPANQQQIFDLSTLQVQTYYGDYGFQPTMVCTFTWSNVQPYPNYLVPYERSCFQIVLLSDYRTSRSYTVFNYNNFQTWAPFRLPGQGYQTADGSLPSVNLPTALTPYFEFLPFIPGNTGEVASWQFQTSNQFCESPNIFNAIYLCYNWYFEQLFIPFYNPFITNPCPCSFQYAINDRRFVMNYNTLCALSAFPYGTYGQSCCYDRFSGGLITYPSYAAGSFLFNHPSYYSYNYNLGDFLAKELCCLLSGLCNLYYQLRPISSCYGYQPPFIGVLFGHPHIITLDGLPYTFNGWGEYWLVKSSVFMFQGRTDLAWDSNGSFVNTATIFVAFAAMELGNNITGNGPSSRVHVQLDLTRTSIWIIVDDLYNQTDWFYASANGDMKIFSFLVLQNNNGSLSVSFPSGCGYTLSVSSYQLLCTVTIPLLTRALVFAGLYGNNNGLPNDDLTPSTGPPALPYNSPENDIFYLFAQTWELESAAVSLFFYLSSQTFAQFQHTSYVPTFGIPANTSLSTLVAANNTCSANGGPVDQNCKQDYILTNGNKRFAQQTRKAQASYDTLSAQNAMNRIIVNLTVDSVQWIVNMSSNITFTITDSNSNETANLYPVINFNGSGLNYYNRTGPSTFTFYWTPANHNTTSLTIQGRDSTNATSPISTVQIAMCDCSGHGTCIRSVLQPGYNQTDPFTLCTCQCTPPGYYNGTYCELDFNACQFNDTCGEGRACIDLTPAQQAAANSTTGYNCSACLAGYIGNGTKCSDIDECANSTLNNCTTGQMCVNTPGSYNCTCASGYIATPAGSNNCTSIDYCGLLLDNCNQNCTDLPGGFMCSCALGYSLTADNATCAVQNGSNPCGSVSCTNGFCQNGQCNCPSGFFLISGVCRDIDECSPPSECGDNSTCVNTPGSFQCMCNTGFVLRADNRSCQACSPGTWGAGCQQICNCVPSVCNNVIGCTNCSTPSITGPNCTQHFNVCTTVSTNPCNSTYSTCVDTNTTAYCQCMPWYTPGGSGTYGCLQLDACKYDMSGTALPMNGSRCMNAGQCVNGTQPSALGNFSCQCAMGYYGNLCQNITNNCNNVSCLMGGNCTNAINGFTCACPPTTYGAYCQHNVTSNETTTEPPTSYSTSQSTSSFTTAQPTSSSTGPVTTNTTTTTPVTTGTTGPISTNTPTANTTTTGTNMTVVNGSQAVTTPTVQGSVVIGSTVGAALGFVAVASLAACLLASLCRPQPPPPRPRIVRVRQPVPRQRMITRFTPSSLPYNGLNGPLTR